MENIQSMKQKSANYNKEKINELETEIKEL